jgi:chromosome segregation ATPase
MPDPSHPSLPESDPAPPVPHSIRPGVSEDEDDLTHLPPEYRAAVRRLRTEVDRAATALNRLQAENERLQRRVEELEQRPAIQPDTTTLVLDDDPEALRERITSFIDAIDTYLEHGTSASEETLPSDNASA